MDIKEAIKWAENRKKKVTYQSVKSSLVWYVFKEAGIGYVVRSQNEVERFKLNNWTYKTK